MRVLNANKGYMIVPRKLLRSNDVVIYDNYDNGVLYKAGIKQESKPSDSYPINKSIVLTADVNYKDAMDWFCEQTLINAFPAFNIASELSVNWVHVKGTGNINNTVRIYIPYDIIGFSNENEDDLYNWMETVAKPIKQYRTTGRMGIVQYLISISQAELDLFAAYPEILIDYK